jgi:hypothetical protein
MAQATPDDHRRSAGELGARVDITVIAGPRGPTPRERLGAVPHHSAIACLLAATIAAAALVASGQLTARQQTAAFPPTTFRPSPVPPDMVLHPTYLRAIGPPAAGPPVSTYPVRCVSLLIALHDPRVLNAVFDRSVPCGRPRGPNTLIGIRAR